MQSPLRYLVHKLIGTFLNGLQLDSLNKVCQELPVPLRHTFRDRSVIFNFFVVVCLFLIHLVGSLM